MDFFAAVKREAIADFVALESSCRLAMSEVERQITVFGWSRAVAEVSKSRLARKTAEAGIGQLTLRD